MKKNFLGKMFQRKVLKNLKNGQPIFLLSAVDACGLDGRKRLVVRFQLHDSYFQP
jgi:hypothetical protein